MDSQDTIRLIGNIESTLHALKESHDKNVKDSEEFRQEVRDRLSGVGNLADLLEGHGRAQVDLEIRLEKLEEQSRVRMITLRNNTRWVRWICSALALFLGDKFTGGKMVKFIYSLVGVKAT